MTTTNKKFFLFDIDGTLLKNDKSVSDKTITALKTLREDGHLVCLATGRSKQIAKPVITNLNFENYITSNGAAAFINHQKVYNLTLDTDELQSFLDFAYENEIECATQSQDYTIAYKKVNDPKVEEVWRDVGYQRPGYSDIFHKNNEINQAVAFYGNAKHSLFEDAPFKTLELIRTHSYGVDVVPKGNSKAKTILEIAKQHSIKQEDIYAFGDGNNDVDMLKVAGVGVAMGNAVYEAKQAATYIAPTNEEDGIYYALKELQMI